MDKNKLVNKEEILSKIEQSKKDFNVDNLPEEAEEELSNGRGDVE